nr:MAG TPA: hypothetical protein [Caudoviricetes sp.]
MLPSVPVPWESVAALLLLPTFKTLLPFLVNLNKIQKNGCFSE